MDTKEKETAVLQKYMAHCAVSSRRKCEELISSGKVKINGKTASLGDRVCIGKDRVSVNGKNIECEKIKKYYIMLHKPRGYVTTLSDEKGRKCVAELVKDVPARIYPAGRLDKDSEGLLIMTNDGDFANNIIHPSRNVWKTYRVTVRSSVTEDQLTNLCVGVEIDGQETYPARVVVLKKEAEKTVLEISIKEGRNRQIRKMCDEVGLEVARLKRISVGSLKLGFLAPGKWRDLKPSEIKQFLR